MWINFKFLHMTDVEKSEISFAVCTIYGILLHFTLFCCKISFFSDLRCFVANSFFLRFTRYCVEKILAKISDRGEKMTNIRYVQALHCMHCWVHFTLLFTLNFALDFELALLNTVEYTAQ